MKKIMATILCVILVFGVVLATSACTKKTTVKNDDEGSSITTQASSAPLSESTLSTEELTTSSTDLISDSSNDLTTTESNISTTDNTLSTNTPSNNASSDNTPLINTPLTNTSSTTTSSNTTPPATQAPSTPNVPRYDHNINRNIVNWIYDGDIVYSLSSSPNKLWVFDATNMQTIADITLPGKPAEIQLINNELLISFPTLKLINYYDQDSLVLKKTLNLPNIVSSFAISNGFVYYSEDDQWCDIYRTNILTLDTVRLNGTYYFPTLLVNESDNLLYVVESHSSGSKAYYFDLNTLNIVTSTQGYGYANNNRTAFFDGNNLYTLNFKIDKLNADSILGEYDYGSISYHPGLLFVNNDYVITQIAIFNKETMEPLYALEGSNIKKALITKSEYLLLFDGSILYVLPND